MESEPHQVSQQLLASLADPSVLTTAQLLRVVASERALTDSQLEVLRERLSGMDRATELLNETVNRVPTALQEAISHVRELIDLGSLSIDKEFAGRDKAIEAALAAQEKQADKSETTTGKLIENLAGQLADLKDRVVRIESIKTGGQQAYAGIYAAVAFAGLVVGAVVGIVIAVNQ
jgi:acyl-CoA reductase-like NAD-dependent aldehyde dehydrogenase